jgi:Mg-chelatase subunit ChlD
MMKQAILLAVALVVTCSQLALAAKASETSQSAKLELKTKPRIEVCFVLDTTGSMAGLIEGAKQKIWSIANEMVSAKPTPELRFGLVAYRDRGDEYVTRRFDLTNDIDAVYANLQGFRAGGGGDMPESVNQALHEAVTQMSWSTSRDVLKIIFLVGDCPPHMDYANEVKYPEVCQQAAKRDLIINTVQCGNQSQTTPVWQEIAKLAEGSYAAIAQSGGMVAMASPMDAELATLNRKLGGTLVAYGAEPARRAVVAKQTAAEAAPASVAADRLYFNLKAGVAVQGEGELLDALSTSKLKLADVKKDQLPADWQKLSESELRAAVEKKQKERAELQAQITKLGKQREEYLAKERQRLAAASKSDSFDEKVAETIRAQAARKGIEYGK